MLRAALAEQQPVVACAGGDARLQVGAQAGDAGAVADQYQRPVGGRRMEAGIGAQAQVDGLARFNALAQPAAAQAGAAVGLGHLPHQQAHAAFGRNRGDRVFAVRQWREGIDQGLRGQATYRFHRGQLQP